MCARRGARRPYLVLQPLLRDCEVEEGHLRGTGRSETAAVSRLQGGGREGEQSLHLGQGASAAEALAVIGSQL